LLAKTETTLADAVRIWLGRFQEALATGDASRLGALFHRDSYWRDLLALTWEICTVCGADAIVRELKARSTETTPTRFALAPGRTPPRHVTRAGTSAIEAMFQLDTALGRGTGVLRLTLAPGDGTDLRAWTLLTALDEIKGHEERVGRSRPTGQSYARDFRGPNWLDQRRAAAQYTNREPAVLVVGGGQAGLSIAARLKMLEIDTLVVDRWPRVGDNWRQRYHALTLHNQVHVNHLPYMPFPPGWPTYIPKDKLAGWLEAYVDSLEIDYWPSTELADGSYDEAEGRWSVVLRRADGSTRQMRPRHVVMATGVSGIPNLPDMPGLENFAGTVQHSSQYGDGETWAGKSAIVVGTGNSGHDVAQDLCASGADVTIVQRSPTYIVSIREAQKVYSTYSEGLPFEDCDLLACSMPYPVLRRAYQLSTAEMREVDRDLLKGLEKRGFRLTFGEDDTGFQMMYLRRGGGYYFNVGCSDMIVDGRIGLLQYDTIDRFEADGVVLKDGTKKPLDVVVVATGYESQQEFVRATLGNGVAERIGPVWGFNEGGELRNMWGPTPQEGLWFTAGSLAQCRIYSRYLALQIKAREDGLI